MMDERDQIARTDVEGRPGLPELLDATMRATLERSCTAAPGIVRAVNASAGTVDVQPAISRRGEEDEAIIPDVPVVQLRTGAAKVTLPVAAGDPVLLIYAHRSLDEWQSAGGGSVVTAADPRAHDPTDAVAVPLGPGSWDAVNLVLTCSGQVLLGGDVSAAIYNALKGSAFNTAMATFLGAMATAGATWSGGAQLLPDVVLYINALVAALTALQAAQGGTAWLSTKVKVA